MDGFKSVHLSTSKELKKSRGFRKKVKELLTRKASNDGMPIQEQLNSSRLGVRRVDVSSLKADVKTSKRNKSMRAEFIKDVTSKILQSVDEPLRESVSSIESNSTKEKNKLNSESTDINNEDATKHIINGSLDMLQNNTKKKILPEQPISDDIFTEKLPPVVQIETLYELIDGMASSHKIKRKLKKQRNSDQSYKTAGAASNNEPSGKEEKQSVSYGEEFKVKQYKITSVPDKVPVLQVEGRLTSGGFIKNNNIVNGSEVHSSSNASDENTLQKEQLPERMDLEPLIVKSDGQNTIKKIIVKKIENMTKNEMGEYTSSNAEITHSLKNVLHLNTSIEFQPTPTRASHSEGKFADRIDPRALITKRLQSLPNKEPNINDMEALRRALETFSASVNRTPLQDNVTEGQCVDFYDLPSDRFLLVLRNGTPVYIRGTVTISVIAGCVEILGTRLVPESKPQKYTIFSPQGFSLLSVQPCKSNSIFIENSVMHSLCADSHPCESLKKTLQKFLVLLRKTLEENDCILMLQKANSCLTDYINLHMPSKFFPSRTSLTKPQRKYSFAEKILECEFLPENSNENVKLFCKKEEWNGLSDVIVSPNRPSVNGSSCTILCGGKGVGKSTLLRFLINRSLESFQRALCLDFDLGQAEFTMPGCISAVVVDKPLLGPNFCHLLKPRRMIYLGDVNVSYCTREFIKGIKEIVEFCKSQEEFKNIPWFVNTMGYSQGLGFELMVNLIHVISPSDVVQIKSRHNKRNFPYHLEAEFVQNYKSSLKAFSCEKGDLSYNFHMIPSAAESDSDGDRPQWGIDARTMRSLVIMAYLSTIVAPPHYNLTAVAPVACCFENLKLRISHETVQPHKILSIMNGNLVGLCVCGDEDVLQPSDPTLPCILSHTPICDCLGFGIVRGVDMEKKQLFLISSLPTDEMQRVNCLVMGRVQLPSCVLLNSAIAGVVGHVPYTVIGPGQPTGRLSQKLPFSLLLTSISTI